MPHQFGNYISLRRTYMRRI